MSCLETLNVTRTAPILTFLRASMTPTQAKVLSHDFLREHSIEINATLPELESVDVLKPQNADSIARRIVIIGHVIGIGYGADTKRLKDSLHKYALWPHASAQEQILLSREHFTDQERINAQWLAECVQSLAYCIGLVELSPFHMCDDNLARHLPQAYSDPSFFIKAAKSRPIDEIYRQADLHYRLHWAARNARHKRMPSDIPEGRIGARRKALEWVIGTATDWDDISLDT